MDWNTFKFIDLFAGIGGIRLGFESVGGKCVFSSEFVEELAESIVTSIASDRVELANELPSVEEVPEIIKNRHYELINCSDWKI